jgi:two-component system, OmpR family, phosphate regulon response regulator PhoB
MTPESTYRSLFKLEQVAGELSKRVEKQLGHTTETIDGLVEQCRKLKATPNKVAFSDIESITQTSRRISGTYSSR